MKSHTRILNQRWLQHPNTSVVMSIDVRPRAKRTVRFQVKVVVMSIDVGPSEIMHCTI